MAFKNGRYQAARIYVDEHIVIENGIIAVENGVIVELGEIRSPSSNVEDLGDVAIVPSLVNAHTHLEFSDLDEPIGYRGIEFTQWLKLVIETRLRAANDVESKSNAIRKGIDESIKAGVRAIGEIASASVRCSDYETDEAGIQVFHERLSRNGGIWPNVVQANSIWMNAAGSVEKSISPHAPYSVHPELLKQLVQQAVQFDCPVAMHIAETREEIELLEKQSGPFVDFLQSIGAWYPESFQPRFSILNYLKVLANAPRSLIVHGNYLNEEEIQFISQHSERMSVVFCPRTHEYFCHEPYPLEKLLAAGINVAIGTDSRASNPDLSIFEELKLIRRNFPRLSDHQILNLGTANGSRALGFSRRFLATGQKSQFIVLPINGDSKLFG